MARALAQDTPVILLDEPLNHLDIKNKIFALELLREEQDESKKTVVAVMHDFADVKNHFTHVIFIKDGGIAYSGPVAEGFDLPLLNRVFDVDFSRYGHFKNTGV
jgi:iron complex transport system ATP-binding protein